MCVSLRESSLAVQHIETLTELISSLSTPIITPLIMTHTHTHQLMHTQTHAHMIHAYTLVNAHRQIIESNTARRIIITAVDD